MPPVQVHLQYEQCRESPAGTVRAQLGPWGTHLCFFPVAFSSPGHCPDMSGFNFLTKRKKWFLSQKCGNQTLAVEAAVPFGIKGSWPIHP